LRFWNGWNDPHIWWLVLGELSNNGVKNGLLEAYISFRTSKRVVIVLWKTIGAIIYVASWQCFWPQIWEMFIVRLAGGGDSLMPGSLLESLDSWSLMDVKFNTEAYNSTHPLYRRGIKLYIGLGTRLGISYIHGLNWTKCCIMWICTINWSWNSIATTRVQQGVCHTVALSFTLKSILRQKKNCRNSNI
jgi:hypothetical protein